MTGWKPNDAGMQPGILQSAGEQLRSMLASLVSILIKGDVDTTPGLIRELGPLRWCEMGADRTGSIAEAGLPQHSQIEQAFHQDECGKGPDRFPREQSALRARQKPVRKSRADTAAIEIDHMTLLAARKDDTPAKGILALMIDESRAQQQIEGVAEIR